MKRFTNGQVGRGRAMHAVHTIGEHKGQTACGKTANDLTYGESPITCKSCRNALPSWTLTVTDEELAEMETEALEQNMAVDAARRAVETADAITANQIRRAENADRILAEDWDAAHDENARRAMATARQLDIWLTKGVVLVDPMLEGDLMVFERWSVKGAEVRSQRTGVLHVVSQSYITTWKYIPRRTDEHQVWRGKETGALVRIVESRPDAVHLLGTDEGDVPFWLSRECLAEYFAWEPKGRD